MNARTKEEAPMKQVRQDMALVIFGGSTLPEILGPTTASLLRTLHAPPVVWFPVATFSGDSP